MAAESTRKEHFRLSQEIISKILKLPAAPGSQKPSFRIGLTGSPGVGKSSFIESFGMYLVNKGHKAAVLVSDLFHSEAVDPSSSKSGGSILGDKTRMTDLSRHENAYIRPSPSSCTLGGVARNTNDAIILCEAAGYDIVMVETVGVGQSETMVADMVDMFVLLVSPGSGDELQGLKKGIVELADMIIINKADGDLANPARMAQMEYSSALKYIQPSSKLWRPPVLPCSSHKRMGFDKIWSNIDEFFQVMTESGDLMQKRGEQQKKWMWTRITETLLDRLKSDEEVKRLVTKLERQVYEGSITSGQAADKVIAKFIEDQKEF